jgi:hypothetical protein
MGICAVGVEILHLARLGSHSSELLASTKRAIDHRAVGCPAQLRPNERTALPRLDVLELNDLENRSLYVDVVAVLELVGVDHGLAA